MRTYMQSSLPQVNMTSPLRSFLRSAPAVLRSPIVLHEFRSPTLTTSASTAGRAGGFPVAKLAMRRHHGCVGLKFKLYGGKGLLRISHSQSHFRQFQASAVAIAKVEAGVSQKRRRKIFPLTPHENIYNIPNILTFSRLLSSPVIGYLVLHDQYAAAISLFVVAGLTDLVDGFIARRWNLQTVVGSVIDPMADKTLMTILTVTLAMQGLLPVWLAGIILGRDVGLAISAIYFRWISLPPPKTMLRYWDFSLPSAEVHPTTISKLNTALQLGLIGACMAHPLISAGADWNIALQAMQYTVATTTIWSGLSYVYSDNAVKILKQPTQQHGRKGRI